MSSGTGRILLVEDEAILAMSTAFMLRERGYSVEHVLDGESALARVAAGAESIDLILMDINLGKGMSGTEAAKDILSSRDIPIVFLSSHTEKSIVGSTEEISCYGYVVKNTGITVLDASIRMAFRLFEARKSIHAKNMAIEAANEELRVTVEELIATNRKLALSEDKFFKAFRMSPDSVNITRLSDGLMIDANSGFTEMSGYSRKEAIDRSSLPGDLGIWAYAADRERIVRNLRESGEVQNFEAEFRRKDGSALIGMMSARVVEIEDETCVLSITRDITDRRLAEDLIKDSESRFRTAFANAPVGMAILSVSGDLRMMNQSFCAMLGYSMMEATSVDFKSFMHPEDMALREEAWRNLLNGDRGTIRFVARYIHKQGQVVWVDERVSLMRGEGETAQGLIIHALDISERKSSEGKSVNLNRLRAAVSEVMQLIVRETDMHALMEGACRIASTRGGFRMVWIGMVDENALVIWPYASAGAVEGYLDGFSIPISDSPEGRGPVGTAMRENRLSIITDIELDERMFPWREKALARGYRSLASFPLRSGSGKNSKVIGIFSFYSEEVDYFGEQEISLLAQLALNLSLALDSYKKEELRAETERKLRESESLYRASFIQSSAVKLLIDPETQAIIDANLAAAEFYGFPIAALTSMKITDLNVASPDRVRDDITLAQGKRQNRFIFSHRLSSGELRDVEVFSSPIEIEGRTLLHSIVHDITEQKKSERALMDSERRFRAVFELAPVGMSMTGPDGRLIEVNKAFLDMLGRLPSDLALAHYSSITYPEDVGPSDDAVRSCLTGEKSSARLAKRYLHADGRPVWADVNIALLRDANGKPSLFITHMLDITERKNAEERLQRLIVEKDMLMKELQHRVKNNLGVVTSLLDLEEAKCSDESARRVLSNAIARVRSISAIYERLYLSEDLANVDLSLYIEDLARSLFSTYNLDSERVFLRIRVDRILLDTKRSVPLGLVLNELLSNALKYAYPAGKGGEVRVELTLDKGSISLEISDDGAGIPDEYLSPENDSMGMTLVRMLVQQLGGALSIENRGGTRVKIKFAL